MLKKFTYLVGVSSIALSFIFNSEASAVEPTNGIIEKHVPTSHVSYFDVTSNDSQITSFVDKNGVLNTITVTTDDNNSFNKNNMLYSSSISLNKGTSTKTITASNFATKLSFKMTVYVPSTVSKSYVKSVSDKYGSASLGSLDDFRLTKGTKYGKLQATFIGFGGLSSSEVSVKGTLSGSKIIVSSFL